MKYFIILFLAFTQIAYSQIAPPNTDAMLFGGVKDAETGEHIPFVNIVVKGTTIGTSTDATGHYMFTDLPLGKITIVASTLGYKTESKTVIMEKDKGQELYFVLEVDAIMTEQVVVSASRNEISRKEATVIVSAITPKHLEAIEANCVADGLTCTPGLRVESNCQNCGFTQLRMNGLEGAYSQILVNSRPVFSGLAGVYGLEQIPTAMIERLEIVRGGGSAIFGGNAIAGTVNIITKDPINNTFQASVKGTATGVGVLKSGGVAYGKKVNFNGAIVSDNRKSGIFLFGLHDEQDPWDANNDGFTEKVKLTNTSAGFQAYYKPSDLSRIGIEYHNLSECRRGGDRLDYLPHEANIAEMIRHNNNSGGITFDTYTNKESMNKLSTYISGQHVNRDSYYGAEKDPYGYGKTIGLTTVAGVQHISNYKKVISVPGILTMGIENLNDRIYDTKLGADTIDNSIVANQMVNTLGAYAQYQINFSRIKLLFGFRLDHYQVEDKEHESEKINGTVINPRGNVLFDLTEKIQLRASYSTGYRAPQIFDEDLHIEASGARRVEHKNQFNLKEEQSQSFSGSLMVGNKLGKWDMELLIEGFYTQLKNPFVTSFEKDSEGIVWSVRSNASEGAKVYGTNIELTAAPSRKFYVQVGGTIQASKYDVAQEWGEDSINKSIYMTRTPTSYAYTIINYQATKKLTFSFSGNYTGSMYIPHLAGGNTADGSLITNEVLFESQNFFDLNIKGSYIVKLTQQVNIEFYGGIKNILNSYQSDHDFGINRDAGYTYGPMRPRTIYLGIKIKM